MFKDNSLTFKTLLVTWTITSFFTLLFTAIQIIYEYRGERRELYETYNIVSDLYVAPISESLWIMNKNIIRTQGISLLGYPNISYVKIYDSNSIYFEDGDPEKADKREFKLKYENEEIGTLQITLDPAKIEQRFFKRVVVTVFIQGLKTFFVCIILFFTYEFLITKSLRRVSRFLISNPDMTSRGEKIPFDYDREDELGVLVRNLNEFIGYIYGLNKNLKELNNTLEKKVDERTKELKEKNKQLVTAIEDLELAHDQIAISERMASLGKMTAGIAHEIKNPVYIISNSVMLIEELLEDYVKEIPLEIKDKLDQSTLEDVKDLCKRTASSSERVSNIINSMLSLSRGTEDEKTIINLGEIVEAAVKFAYEATMAKSIFSCELDLDISKDIPSFLAYRTDLSRAVINICDNAFYSMRKKHIEDKTSKQVLKVVLKVENDFIVIIVKDTGLGIPEDVAKNLFYPFFTTKPAGEGTGLGMSLTFDIIKKHGGDISVSSVFGEGATFTIKLPKGDSHES